MSKALTKEQKTEVSKSKLDSTRRAKSRFRKTQLMGLGGGLIASTVAAKTIANKPIQKDPKAALGKLPIGFAVGLGGAALMALSTKPMVVAAGIAASHVGTSEWYLQQYLNRRDRKEGYRGGFNPDINERDNFSEGE